MTNAQHDVWAVGEGYERYVGRWSRLVAPELRARAWHSGGTKLARRRLRYRCAEPNDPAPRIACPRDRCRSVRRLARFRTCANHRPPRRIPPGRCAGDTRARRLIRRDRLRPRAEFHSGPGQGISRDAPRHAAGRHGRRLCVGLCRRDAAHASLLGRGRRAQAGRTRVRRRHPLPGVPAGAAPCPLQCGRPAERGGESHRRADGLQGFRRLLVTVPCAARARRRGIARPYPRPIVSRYAIASVPDCLSRPMEAFP